MPTSLTVRPIQASDFAAWHPLWLGYNAFYGREAATSLPEEITQATWQRFFDSSEPVFAQVAERGTELVGMTHYLLHRSTTRIELTCYLQDLFTAETARGQGVARALIVGVYEAAKTLGVKRVYWQTHHTNSAARLLYDKVAQQAGFIVYGHEV
jgi:GNAT superfamily N-acetyltransferase